MRAYQREAPAGQAGRTFVEGVGPARQRRHPPAGLRRARRAEFVVAQQQRRRSALGRSEGEAAAGGERDALDLGQHRRERAAAQPLLHRPGHVLLAAGAEDQQVRRLQAEVAPARPVEAAEAGGAVSALADQHRAALATAFAATHPPRQ